MTYLLLFLAGGLLCNALPHLIKGLSGEAFYTPWASPRGIGKSSALENVLWGAANLLVSVFLLDRKMGENIPHGLVVIALGFILIGVLSALVFGRRNARKG